MKKYITQFLNKLNKAENNFLDARGILFKLLLLFTFLGGAYLRLKELSFQSLWYDEIGTLSYYNADRSLLEVIRLSIKDHFLPLFNILLWSSFKIFGTSVLVGRGLTALFGILTLGVCYLIGKNTKDNFSGWCVLLAVAVNPGLIYYSQEMRPYALMVLLLCCAYLYLIKFLQTQMNRHFYLFSFFCLLSMYTHFFSFVGILHFILILFLNRKVIQNRTVIRNGLQICFLALVPVIINTFEIFLDFKSAENRWAWIPVSSFGKLASINNDWFGRYLTLPTLFILMFGFFNRKLRTSQSAFWFGYQGIFLFSVFLTFELFSKPFVQARYFLWINLCIAVQTGICLATFKRFRLLLPTLFLVFGLGGLIIDKSFYWFKTKSDYREILTFLNSDRKIPVACFSFHSSGIKKYYELLFQENMNTLSNSRKPTEGFYLFWDRSPEILEMVNFLKKIKHSGEAHLFYLEPLQLDSMPAFIVQRISWHCE